MADESGVTTRPTPMPERIVNPPEDLAAGLDKDPEAMAHWNELPPSHRQEYVEWIEEAGQPETRADRVSKTLDILREMQR